MDLSGQTILVTGATSGIGEAFVRAASAVGASMVCLARPESEERCKALHPSARIVVADLQDPECVGKAVDRFTRTTKLDGIAQCAVRYGGTGRARFESFDLMCWRELTAVNFLSQVAIIRGALPAMLEARRGILLGVTSPAAFDAAAGRSPYGSTKSAVHALYITLAEELSGSDVSAVQVRPMRHVHTAGIEKRRPSNFDYSEYMHADTVAAAMVPIFAQRGDALNGRVVDIN